jgi:DNA modification methylase
MDIGGRTLKQQGTKITLAKGRPMLHWVGKKPLEFIKSFPAQLVEVFDPARKLEAEPIPAYEKLEKSWYNLLFHGDNAEVLGFLLANGFREKVDLVYIDPPFDSNANYIRQVELRGVKQRTPIEGEGYTLGEQIQYTDIWANDSYLQFMYERLILLKETLSDQGVIVLHCDWHKDHHLRLLLDEIFGQENFINEIIWYHWTKFQMRQMGSLTRNHDTLLVYAKNADSHIMNPLTRPLDRPKKLKRIYWDKEKGKIQNVKDAQGHVIYNEVNDEKVDDVWDIPHLGTKARERGDFPTQKPVELLDYVVNTFSNPSSIVLDCFIGSGTTAVSAQKNARRWIGADINRGAIQATSKRIQELLEHPQAKLADDSGFQTSGFAFYNVNDYDLRLLGVEAKELAAEHIGIQRTRTDQFFDGTLGGKLAKVIDFNHPLTPYDLQIVQDELRKRPEENRDVTIVCLGKELAVDPWISDYNKKHPVNKFEVIELRTDSKYGKLLVYRPPEARIDAKRSGSKARVKLTHFVSPSIVDRINDPERLVSVKIKDFRSMIDVILIDANYDGKVFKITHSDVPQSKEALVMGSYELEIPKSKTTVAVKVVDMLGEECVATATI